MRSSEPSIKQKARYYSSVSGLYLMTLLFALYVFSPWFLYNKPTPFTAAVLAQPSLPLPAAAVKITSGKPVRVVIPRLSLDLPVNEGLYNPSDQTWTLSGYHAHFATISKLANDYSGSTFIYGHNNKHVFGPLKSLIPGDHVQLFTDNGHVFLYTYQNSENVKPDQVSLFDYQGPPILVIQTCSGSFNEWRQVFFFNLNKLEQ